MERLTDSNKEIPDLKNERKWLDMYFKLKEYEDAEENGLLVRLPCKVGDCLYSIALGRVTKHKVYGCRYNGNDVFLLWVPGEFRVDGTPAKSIGKTVFLTQAEAEAKLKEMEGENEI